MPIYEFTVPSIWEQVYLVEADSPEAAKAAWAAGKAEAYDDNSLTYVGDLPGYTGPDPVNLRLVVNDTDD